MDLALFCDGLPQPEQGSPAIYEYMEGATDRCEDVADVLEGVALKHA